MKKNIVIWAILLILTLVGYFMYLNLGILVIFFLIMTIPPISFVMNLIVSGNMEIEILVEELGEKNKELCGTIKLENPTVFKLDRLELNLEIENLLTKEIEKNRVIGSVNGHRSAEIPFEIKSLCCGTLNLTIKKIKIWDTFGIIAKTKTLYWNKKICIMPNTFSQEISVDHNGIADIEAVEYSQKKPGDDVSEIFDIREYRYGDSLKRVHWKLTSKYDELMVMRPSLPIEQSILIITENLYTQDMEVPNEKSLDAMAEIQVSLCYNLLLEGIQSHIGYFDENSHSMIFEKIENQKDLTVLIPKIISAGPRHQGESNSYYVNKEKIGLDFAHIVYIVGNEKQILLNESMKSGTTALVELCLGKHFDLMVLGATEKKINFTTENYMEELFSMVI